jgi:hypothetical protein
VAVWDSGISEPGCDKSARNKRSRSCLIASWFHRQMLQIQHYILMILTSLPHVFNVFFLHAFSRQLSFNWLRSVSHFVRYAFVMRVYFICGPFSISIQQKALLCGVQRSPLTTCTIAKDTLWPDADSETVQCGTVVDKSYYFRSVQINQIRARRRDKI